MKALQTEVATFSVSATRFCRAGLGTQMHATHRPVAAVTTPAPCGGVVECGVGLVEYAWPSLGGVIVPSALRPTMALTTSAGAWRSTSAPWAPF